MENDIIPINYMDDRVLKTILNRAAGLQDFYRFIFQESYGQLKVLLSNYALSAKIKIYQPISITR